MNLERLLPAEKRSFFLICRDTALLVLGLAAAAFASWRLVQGGLPLALLARTLALAGGAAAISLPLGTLLALLIVRTNQPGRSAAGTLLLTLLGVPLYLQAAGWDAGFGSLGWFSLMTGRVADPLLQTWRAAIWIHAMAAVPWVALIVGVGLRYVARELEEDAWLDGNLRQVFLRVTLPRMLPAVLVAALWVLVSTSSEMTVTDLYRVRTYAEVIYTDLALGRDQAEIWQAVLPIGLLVAVAASVVLATAARGVPPDSPSLGRPALLFPLGKFRWLAALFVAGCLLLLVGLPLGNLVYKAGLIVEQVGDQRVRTWSAEQFTDVLSAIPTTYAAEFGWTAAIGALTASAALLVALPLAWLARRAGLAAIVIWPLVAAGLAIPGPLVGLSVIWLLNREDIPGLTWLYDDTFAAPVLAMLIKVFPLALLVAWFGLRSLDREPLEVAQTEGAGRLNRFARIALPQRLSVLAAVWWLSFVLATGDLAASILVMPPGTATTIQIRVFGLVHAGVDHQVAGISLVVAAAYGLLALVTTLLSPLILGRDRAGPTI